MTSQDDDDTPMDPAESLRLIEQQRAAAERSLTPDPRLFLWPWGFAWLIAFTLFFLRYGPDGRVFVDLPGWLPLVTLAVLIMVAGAISGVAGARSARHISGPSSNQGAMFGVTWAVAFTGLSLVLSQVSDLLPEPQASLLWAGGMVALTGALHMAGGALYRDPITFGLGAFVSVVNVAGVLLGPGWHALLLAVFGGGGMLVAGVVAKRRAPR